MKNILARIMKATEYRFKKDGFFGRGSIARKALRAIGVSVIELNIKADLME